MLCIAFNRSIKVFGRVEQVGGVYVMYIAQPQANPGPKWDCRSSSSSSVLISFSLTPRGMLRQC